MSSQSTNLKLIKPAGGENLSRSDYNDNLDTIDTALGSGFGLSNASSVNAEINALGDAFAIIANGNTHAAITSGQFVYVRQHSTLSDGLYVASSNISANATLSGSNLTANASGGLNALNSNLNYLEKPTQISCSSLSDVKTAISNAINAMADNEVRRIVLSFTSNFAPFYAQRSVVELYRANSSNFSGIAYNSGSDTMTVQIKYSNSTWYFDELALNANIAKFTVVEDRFSGQGVSVYRQGKVCTLICNGGTWYSDSANSAIRLNSATGTQWVIAEGFRPPTAVDIREANHNKRISIGADGQVVCSEQLSGVTLRFSASWMAV